MSKAIFEIAKHTPITQEKVFNLSLLHNNLSEVDCPDCIYYEVIHGQKYKVGLCDYHKQYDYNAKQISYTGKI